MTTSTGRDCDESNPRQNDSYQNPNSAMSTSQQPPPPSGPILPGGPNGPDGTIIEEVMTPVVNRKQPVRGQAYRAQNGEYVSYFCTDEEVLYRPGDSVYIESQKADQPYFICSILEFRRSKRDDLMVNIKWFYRPSEVPETVYQLLIQDRSSENNNKALAIDVPAVKSRELFISDATDTYPVSVLKGICKVEHYADIHAVRGFQPEPNSFFYILGYNPETRRLASAQGEIRIGPSHQAKLPEYRGSLDVEDRPEKCEDWEVLCWQPGIFADEDLMIYLNAARSISAFASVCDNGSLTDGTCPAAKDSTTIGALNVLHDANYERDKALQALTKCPIPEDISNKWSEEDIKRFVKGLRMYGKNFFRIRKEFIPHKETRDLVSFYYLWKKTPAAIGHRPHRRHRRQNILRRIRTPRGTARNTGPADPLDPSSTSEKEDDSDDSDSKDRQGYHCRHCYTTASRDWHHAGKGKQLLCYDCRMYFKHYGDLPVITNPREPPPPSTATRPIQQPVVQEEVGMRTRARAKEISTRQRVSLRSGANTPDIVDDSDSHTSDRRTPDPRPASRSISPSAKKIEPKSEKAKPVQLAEEESFMTFNGSDKKEEEPLDASSEESMDSFSDANSTKSAEATKVVATPDKEAGMNLANIQSCSVILKTTPVSSQNQFTGLYKSSDAVSTFDNSALTTVVSSCSDSGAIKRRHPTPDNEIKSKYPCYSPISGSTSYPLVPGAPSEPSAIPVSKEPTICSPLSPHPNIAVPEVSKCKVDKDALPSRATTATGEVSHFSPTQLGVSSVTDNQIAPTLEEIPTAPEHMDATDISHSLSVPSAHTAKVTETPAMAVAQNLHLPPSLLSFVAGSATTSVIHTSHVTEACSVTTTSSGSRTPPLAHPSTGSALNSLSVASMLSKQPPRISLVPTGQLRTGASSPSYAPPPAHVSIPMALPPAFLSITPPPVAHPSSTQLFRPHPVAAPLSHSAMALAHSSLNVTSHDDTKSSRGQSPKDPLALITSHSSSSLSEHPFSAPKMPLRGQDGGYYMGSGHSSQHGIPHGMLSSSGHGLLSSRSEKPNIPPASIQSHDYSVKIENENLAYPGIGVNFPYGKSPYHDSPLSLAASDVETMKIQRIPSPVHLGVGSRVICSSKSGPPKLEYVKKELDFAKDRIKSEMSGEYYRPEYKPDNSKIERMEFKQERCEVKQERHDRPEIIEINADNKAVMPTNLSVTGLLAPSVSQMAASHYPYPYLPQQNPLMSVKFQRASSPSNMSKNTSPPMQMIGPAPPAHLGLPNFSGRPSISSVSKTSGIQHSPGISVKSPISAIRMGRESEALSLPTPPAAHTGPVRPPMASHPLHSPLSCITQGPQSLGAQPLSQHALPPPPSPTCQSDQLPTTQALPPTVPPHSAFNNGNSMLMHVDGDDRDDEDDLQPQREPSPVPKIEDSECHRSQSAIFLRHWNRGEFNSCARTDLTFKPVPDSQLSRKREERARRQAEKDERERHQKKTATPEKRETPKPVYSGISEAHVPTYPPSSSMYDRLLPRNPEIPISTIPRLTSIPSTTLRSQGLGLPQFGGAGAAAHIDPLLQHYNVSSLYPLGSRERIELERERDLDRFREEIMRQRSHIEGLAAPYGVGLPPHLLTGPRFPNPLQTPGHGAAFPPAGLYGHPPASIFAAERDRFERIAIANYHAASARPQLMRPPDSHQRLPHGYPPSAHPALLGRPFEEQLAQRAAHDQMQRQILMERERISQFTPQGHFRP